MRKFTVKQTVELDGEAEDIMTDFLRLERQIKKFTRQDLENMPDKPRLALYLKGEEVKSVIQDFIKGFKEGKND